MNLLMKFIILCIIIPMVSLYQHKIYLSEKFPNTKCQKINNTTYQCSSLTEVFQQLSNCWNSTDIYIKPGNYKLAISYVLEDLHNIRIRSEGKAVIQCSFNANGTGVAFVRVTNLVINNISILGCGMKHNTTNYITVGKFIVVRSALFIQNSTNISLDNVDIAKSNGIGLLVYDTNGYVNITKSYFANNTLGSSMQSRSFTGGGGVHIEFTECTPGWTKCDPISNQYNTLTKYTIDQCVFKGNAAIYHLGDNESEDLDQKALKTFGTGGGLSLWFHGNAHNNIFQVTLTSFISNRAFNGGGIYVHSRQNSQNNTVQISGCHFVRNYGEIGGGGLTLGNVIRQTGGQSLFNTYMIANCWFVLNQGKIGGGIAGFGSREPQNTQSTNRFEIYNTFFINNVAQYGSAIEINREYYDSIVIGTIFTLVLNNCTFISNSHYKSNQLSNSISVGTVAMSGVNVEFRGTTMFSDNNSTALVVDGASARFNNDSQTTFQNNNGLHGGAISLIGGAWIKIYPNSSLQFLNNTAVKHGGAIYVALSTPFDYLFSRACFIRYHNESILSSKWETNFTFINNTVGNSNSAIFASTLHPCVKAYNKLLFNNPFHFYPSTNNSMISTLPATFKFSDEVDIKFTIVPGETFHIPVKLVDELGQDVHDAMFIATCIRPSKAFVLPTYHFTNGLIKVAGKPGEICELQMKTDTDYPVSSTIQLFLQECPPGFVYNNKKEQCECMVDHIHKNPAISGCELESFQAYFDRFYWIGYKSVDAADLLISPCPYRYCYQDHVTHGQLLPQDANKTILDEFVCGNRSRTGLLCGQCIEGYSVALNSPTFTCHKCKNPYLGILYLVLSYIIPVSVLFYIIMAYNIRMTTGPIGAFLFFSQIISSQYRFAFDYSVKANSDETLAASNVILTIYSIANLEFFYHDVFSYCLFPNAGTVDILAFNLLLSFYPVFLVFVYFLLRRYCICKLQCCQRFRLSTNSVNHGLCAFLVLCFAKINVLAFGILKSAELQYINGTNFRNVVYLQGSFRYFGDLWYVVYATASFFAIVTVISMPTLILVCHPIFNGIVRHFEWGDTKYVTFINKLLFIHKLKPKLDSFQGDYKDNLTFFAGLHSFLYRIIFFCIIVAVSAPDINITLLLMIAFFMTILLIHILVMPFKRFIDNASYSLIYVLMLTIVIIEHYVFSTGKSSSGYGLIWLEIILSLIPFICVILYCLWKLLTVGRQIWKKHYQSDDETHLDDYRLLDFPERVYNDDGNDDNNTK